VRTFKIQIITPDKILFDGDAQYCGVTTPTGAVGFEARHAATAAILQKGSEILVRTADGTEKNVAVKDGILVFRDNICTITATSA
jgi:F-type H+-transporting ATPase subunit epsilon